MKRWQFARSPLLSKKIWRYIFDKDISAVLKSITATIARNENLPAAYFALDPFYQNCLGMVKTGDISALEIKL